MEIIETLKSEGCSIVMICNVLHISRSRYYRTKTQKTAAQPETDMTVREDKDKLLLEIIGELKLHHPAWGYRRIRSFIKRKRLIPVSYKKVYRIMKANGFLNEIKRYKAKRTPQYSKPRPSKINQWWGTDMTKFRVNSVGWLYLVIVIDWYSKKILGYKLGLRSKAEDWLEALYLAVDERCPLGAREYDICLMSDNGSQPTSTKYENAIETLGLNHVTTSYSNPKGNADTERFMRTFKEEVVHPCEYDSFEEAKKAVDDFMLFYNRDYPHSTIDYMSPIDFENSINLKNVA